MLSLILLVPLDLLKSLSLLLLSFRFQSVVSLLASLSLTLELKRSLQSCCVPLSVLVHPHLLLVASKVLSLALTLDELSRLFSSNSLFHRLNG